MATLLSAKAFQLRISLHVPSEAVRNEVDGREQDQSKETSLMVKYREDICFGRSGVGYPTIERQPPAKPQSLVGIGI